MRRPYNRDEGRPNRNRSKSSSHFDSYVLKPYGIARAIQSSYAGDVPDADRLR